MNYATRQRTAVQKVLHDAGRPLTPDEIRQAAAAISPGLGIATVYRSLRILMEMNAVEMVEIPGAPPHYESKRAHHHHFLCEVCRKIYTVENCSPDIGRLAPPAFTLRHHTLALYGVCADPACVQNALRNPPPAAPPQ